MIKACLIGVSGYGATHYGYLMDEAREGRAQVVAATVINPDEEAEKCANLRGMGCEIFADYREMLDRFSGKADVCLIPTGIHWHAPMTIDALRAGINVYVEKPVAATLQDVRAMREARDQSGKFVAVGYQTIYASETMIMKRAILDGRLGEIRSISCVGLWPRDRAYYQRNNWAGRLRVGDHWVLDSPGNNAIAHQLNMICFLAGTEPHRSARLKSLAAELYRANEIESADTMSLRVETESGPTLHYHVTHASDQSLNPDIEVRGSKGSMYWTYHKSLAIKIDGKPEETYPADNGPALRRRIFQALGDRLHHPAAFVCDLEIAATQTLCVNAAHEFFPIRTIPSEYVRKEGAEGRSRAIVKGLDEAMLRAFREEKMLGETGLAWTTPGKPVDLSDYQEFQGPKRLDS